jgi:hypothetical protein
MSVAAEAHGKLEINRVVRDSLLVLRRNWRSLVRPAVLFLYLPGVLAAIFRPHMGPAGGPAGGIVGAPLLALLAAVAEVGLYALFQGALYRLTVADLNAEAISVEDALKVGRERMWPLLGLTILAGLGVAAGLALLIVPGVLLALAWSVVGPVLIEERTPVMRTFGRSAELTRHSRLNIFGVGLVFIAAEIIGALVFALIGAPFPEAVASSLIMPVYATIVGVVTGVVVAVIYDELRRLKGGPAAGEAGAV